MLKEKDRIDRNYHLFWLNGSYNRELVGLQRRLFEIKQSMSNHPDDPVKAAHECGFKTIDSKHPAEQQMIITMTALEAEINWRWSWKEHVGIDDYISSLPQVQQDFVNYLFDENMTLECAGKLSGISRCRQAADYRLRKILKKFGIDENL